MEEEERKKERKKKGKKERKGSKFRPSTHTVKTSQARVTWLCGREEGEVLPGHIDKKLVHASAESTVLGRV